MAKVDCRIFGLMAREAPTCVLFRHGPAKWVQLIAWRTDKDAFQPGDWFHGRVYERRGDVSPNGRHLLYFASKVNCHTLKWEPAESEYGPAWTAVSRPPSFKAEMLWPRPDCWHGGGLFVSNREVWLNHKPEVAAPDPEFSPLKLKFTPNPEAVGEDEPVYEKRLERDGWQCLQRGKFREIGRSRWIGEPGEVWEKKGKGGQALRRELLAFNSMRKFGRYTEAYSLVPPGGNPVRLPGANWADFDQQGRLVFSRDGKVLRGRLAGGRLEEEELINLAENQPPSRELIAGPTH